MFCGKCGKQLPDTAKFCSGCGASVGAPQPEEVIAPQPEETVVVQSEQAAAPQPEEIAAPQPVAPEAAEPVQEPVAQPEKPKKKPNKIVTIAVAAVAVVAIIALLFGMMGGASGKVAKALGKSMDAYAEAYEKVGLPNVSELLADQQFSMDLNVWIDELADEAILEGMGVILNVDYSLNKHALGVGVVPYAGAAEILHAQLKLDDTKLYAGLTEITDDTFYMVDTATILADLEEMGADLDGMEEISINIFEIIEKLTEAEALGKDAAKDIEKAVDAFVKTIEVEKADDDDIKVNGEKLDCKVYHVVVTEDALAELVDAVEEAYGTIDKESYYQELVQVVNLPEDMAEEMVDAMVSADESSEDVFDGIRDAVDTLGDVELDLYLNDGYVVAAVYETKLNGSKLEVELQLGGNENYVDDLSLKVTVDNENEILLSCSGNHTGEGGEYTTEMALYMTESGQRVKLAQIEASYEPKAKKDNISISFTAEGATVEMEGRLDGGKNELALKLDEVEFTQYGRQVVTLGIECSIGKYDPAKISTKGAVNLGELTEEELMELGQELAEDATDWLYDLQDEFPQLAGLLY